MSSNNSHSVYLHGAQRAWIQQLARQWSWRLELPTWGIIALVYGSWFGVVHYWPLLGPWLGTPLLIVATAGYMSLQHELIHGHPTRWPRLNHLLGLLPLAVWYPYGLYRDSHLKHHRDQHLTLPEDDPESYYFSQAQWQRWPIWLPLLTKVRNTLTGRIVLGPALDIASTLINALRAILAGNVRTLAMWLVHGALLVPMLFWLQAHGLSAGFYLLAVSYPALGLTKVRSFFEHRAVEAPQARSVINEASWPWRLLFLNLNYHLVHHDLPGLPWYGLRKVYLAEQEAYRQRSQGFVVAGYGVWLAEYAFTPVAVEVHPFAAKNLVEGVQNGWPTLSLARWAGAAQDFPTDPAK